MARLRDGNGRVDVARFVAAKKAWLADASARLGLHDPTLPELDAPFEVYGWELVGWVRRVGRPDVRYLVLADGSVALPRPNETRDRLEVVADRGETP